MSYAQLGSIWQHSNGTKYEVLFYTNTKSTREDYPLMITYKDITNGHIWTKPYYLWLNNRKWFSNPTVDAQHS